jgi:signal transduction histidine kinase
MVEGRDDASGTARLGGGRLIPAAVLIALALAAVTAFVVVRRAVDDQNGRILRERTGEVGLLLQSAVTDLSSTMQPLGVAQRLGGTAQFQRLADAQTAAAPTQTLALVRATGGAPTVVAVSGAPATSVGATLTGAPAQAVAAAVASGKLEATPVFHAAGSPMIGFALGPPATAPGTAVLLEAAIHPKPSATHQVTQQQAFNELDVALYATGRPSPGQLVLATTATPLGGQVATDRITIGDGQWLLAARARESLVGTYADAVPWIVLGVGLLGAVVAAGIVLFFQRRRDYALALVDARTAELNTSLDQLEDAQARLVFQERLAAIGQVAAAVGHELRNPLGVLTNSLYLLRAAVPGGDSVKVERHLATAEREIGAAVVIVEGLLDFARQHEPDPEPVSLGELVDESLSVASPPPGIAIVRLGVDELADIRVDRQQLRQVLLNLLTNAYAAMAGEGVLTIEAAADGDDVRVTVTDTGSGMDEETANHIFDPFYTRKAKGIGLGLAVTRRIVEAHDGAIAVTSTPDVGTTFTISLPRALSGAEAVQA